MIEGSSTFATQEKETTQALRPNVVEHTVYPAFIDEPPEYETSETMVFPPDSGSGVVAVESSPSTCAPAQTEKPIFFPTATIYMNDYFVIRGGPEVNWLPPKPDNPKATIAGVDVDGDCVRDDIEYYIAQKYGAKGQYKLRKYLYEYAAWMARFLIRNISENSAKTAYRKMAVAGECVDRIIGETASTRAIDDLFAKFHNTVSRSYRYIENLKQTSGWTTREKLKITCP